jgi:hypothetical protein
MSSMEFGRKPEQPSNAIDDITFNWRAAFPRVYENKETEDMVARLIKKAKLNYLENPEWINTIKSVRAQLAETDEEDEIREILLEAIGDDEDDKDLDDVESDQVEDEEAA